MENNNIKSESELQYWRERVDIEKTLDNEHYTQFYINYLNFEKYEFVNKKILDIGCGPRGSLEWADMANLRIGIDPLVNEYYKLNGGTLFHEMKYVNCQSENMPFPDNLFDYVFSINSLDHVDNLNETISEIKRVLKVNGICGIIVEGNHPPTPTEPISIPLNLKKEFEDSFEIIDERIYEIPNRSRMYEGVDQQIFYDFKNLNQRPAIIILKMRKIL